MSSKVFSRSLISHTTSWIWWSKTLHQILKEFRHTLLESARNLIPILLIIIGFQLLVFQSVPDNVWSISLGFVIVIIGVTFFLMGLEIGIFPLGNSLSSEFLERKSLILFGL